MFLKMFNSGLSFRCGIIKPTVGHVARQSITKNGCIGILSEAFHHHQRCTGTPVNHVTRTHSKIDVLTCNLPVLYHQRCSKVSLSGHYAKWTELSFEDLVALLDSGDVQLFDVREPKELQSTGKIETAINIPLGQLKEALQMTDINFTSCYKVSKPQKHDTNIIFYGLGPIKSSAALELANKLGYTKTRHYSGGYEEWCKLYKARAKN